MSARRKVLLTGGAAVAALAAVALTGRRCTGSGRVVEDEENMTTHPFLQAKLTARWHTGALEVTLVIENRSSSETGLLLRYNLPLDGSVENNIFRGDSRDELRYLGGYAKRKAPVPADFLKLAPGASLELVVDDLTQYYEVPRFATLRFRYEAYHTPPQAEQLYSLQSNEVEIAA